MTKCKPGNCVVAEKGLWIYEKDLKTLGFSNPKCSCKNCNFFTKFISCDKCGHEIDWERIERELND